MLFTMLVKLIIVYIGLCIVVSTVECGGTAKRVLGLKNRMAHTRPSNFSDYPYVVQLVAGMTSCTGTIIGPHWVLTAAHCMINRPWLSWVVAGSGDNRDPPCCPQRVLIRDAILHPNHNSKPENDIALLKLRRDLVYNTFVLPIPLSGKGKAKIKNGTAVGWGSVIDNDELFSFWRSPHRFTNVTIMNQGKCDEEETDENFDENFEDDTFHGFLTDDFEDPDEGNLGGPLVDIMNNGDHELIGVLSKTTKVCKNPELPIVQWIKISMHLDWIERETGVKANNTQDIDKIVKKAAVCPKTMGNSGPSAICYLDERTQSQVPPSLLEYLSPMMGLIYLARLGLS